MSAEARKLSEAEAQDVARRWSEGLSPLRAGKGLRLVYTGSDTLLYGYNVEERGGFVVVSGDDRVRPVLGYAQGGELIPEAMPENLQAWLTFYAQEIRRLSILPEEREPSPLRTETVAEKLLETPCWNQTDPYNVFCPVNMRLKQRTAAGCVATAMAEVMYYHRWPERGMGGSSYEYIEDRRQLLYESFTMWYDWDNMLATYVEGRWTSEEEEAVGRLMYHCGRAVNMNYGVSGSGATSFAMQESLINNFSYDAGCCLAFRDLYGEQEWERMMKAEIAEGRPVLYSGSGEEGGHMFVVDGFREDGFFHVNWGWSGISNGYFVLSALDPSEQGTGGSSDGKGFNTQQDALLGLRPATSDVQSPHWEIFFSFLGTSASVPGIYASTDKIDVGRSFNLCYSGLLNYGYRTYAGQFFFLIEDSTGRIKDTVGEIDWATKRGYLSPNVIHNDASGIQTVINTEICEGDRIRLYYTLDGGDLQPVRGEVGANLTIELRPVASHTGITEIRATHLAPLLHRCYDLIGRIIPCGSVNTPYIEVLRDKESNITSSLRVPAGH